MKKYREANPEVFRQANKRYYQRHKEDIKQKMRDKYRARKQAVQPNSDGGDEREAKVEHHQEIDGSKVENI